MPHIYRTALVPYQAEKMYQLVNDVASYPEFLAWCESTRIHYQSDSEMKATVNIAKSGVRKSFTTKNQCIPYEKILIELTNGPFEYLHGEWTFKHLSDNGCKVELSLEFELKKGLMNYAFKKIFEPAASSMMKAFIDRATEIYG